MALFWALAPEFSVLIVVSKIRSFIYRGHFRCQVLAMFGSQFPTHVPETSMLAVLLRSCLSALGSRFSSMITRFRAFSSVRTAP